MVVCSDRVPVSLLCYPSSLADLSVITFSILSFYRNVQRNNSASLSMHGTRSIRQAPALGCPDLSHSMARNVALGIPWHTRKNTFGKN